MRFKLKNVSFISHIGWHEVFCCCSCYCSGLVAVLDFSVLFLFSTFIGHILYLLHWNINVLRSSDVCNLLANNPKQNATATLYFIFTHFTFIVTRALYRVYICILWRKKNVLGTEYIYWFNRCGLMLIVQSIGNFCHWTPNHFLSHNIKFIFKCTFEDVQRSRHWILLMMMNCWIAQLNQTKYENTIRKPF